MNKTTHTSTDLYWLLPYVCYDLIFNSVRVKHGGQIVALRVFRPTMLAALHVHVAERRAQRGEPRGISQIKYLNKYFNGFYISEFLPLMQPRKYCVYCICVCVYIFVDLCHIRNIRHTIILMTIPIYITIQVYYLYNDSRPT